MTELPTQDPRSSSMDYLYRLLYEDKLSQARSVLASMHPSEIADVMESMPGRARATIWNLLSPEAEGDVLSELQVSVRNELLEGMQPFQVARFTSHLDTDDAADILQELPDDIKDTVLLAMDEQNRQRLASVLSYPEDTAGGLMNIDVVSVRADVTLDVVMRYMRLLRDIPPRTDNLMVVDRENKYLGVLSLADILSKDPESTVGAVMSRRTCIPALTPAHEVARIFEQRDLFSAAVVNENNLLLGRITVDDVVDVIQEEAEQTVRHLAGLGLDDMFAPVLASVKRRSIWLAVNVCTAFLAAAVIGQFEDAIEALVALAVLLPIVAGMGGIAGSQTLTITVRGIALGQLHKSNVRALILKELAVGLLNGVIWAGVVGTAVYLWFDNSHLGAVIGFAMFINLGVAALSGTTIPLILKRLGIDPAIASPVFLTTITDVVGFMTFLGLAAWLLLP